MKCREKCNLRMLGSDCFASLEGFSATPGMPSILGGITFHQLADFQSLKAPVIDAASWLPVIGNENSMKLLRLETLSHPPPLKFLAHEVTRLQVLKGTADDVVRKSSHVIAVNSPVHFKALSEEWKGGSKQKDCRSDEWRDERRNSRGIFASFCSRKFTLNKTLTTWPKFLLFNPGACHTHIKWFFTASWWQKLSAGVASDRFGVVLINGFPPRFASLSPPTTRLSQFQLSEAAKSLVKALPVYWLINQYQKATPTPLRQTSDLPSIYRLLVSDTK